MELNSKQLDILQSIFTDPVSSTIRWKDVTSLWEALGATIEERQGSRVAVSLNGIVGHFHRPHHPQPEIPKWMVKKIRQFLENAEVQIPPLN